jgi:hypothetical protein
MERVNLEERVRLLMLRAEAEFGRERAEELRPAIRKMAEELELLHSYTLDFEDEP